MSNSCSCKTISYDRQFILAHIDNAIKDFESLPNQHALDYLKNHISNEIDSFVAENNSKIMNRIFKSGQIDPSDPCVEEAKDLVYLYVTSRANSGLSLHIRAFYELQEVKDNRLLMIERHRYSNGRYNFVYDYLAEEHWHWKYCSVFVRSEQRERRIVSKLKELKSLAYNSSNKTTITLNTDDIFVQYVSGLTPAQVTTNVAIIDILKDEKDREYDF